MYAFLAFFFLVYVQNSSFSAMVTEAQILLIECNWQDCWKKIEIRGTWMFQINRVTTVNSVCRI